MSLGKRKREPIRSRKIEDEQIDSDDDVRARFQKAFEAKFKPLPREEQQVKAAEPLGEEDDDEDEQDDEDDWEGISEDDGVEIVQHAGAQELDRLAQKREMKAFMSSKPPSLSMDAQKPTKKKTALTKDEDDTETANLKNDLALQRLLKESHLLDPTSFSKSSSTVPEGKARIKALGLRLQDAGAKKVVEKMPMSHRKGIQAKADKREKSRRKEAAENGIILERATAAPQKSNRHRERGIGAPSVGKFSGGTLKLSGKDVRSIKGASRPVTGRRR